MTRLDADEGLDRESGSEFGAGNALRAVAYIDGASRGNPGPAACAAVLNVEGRPPRELAVYLGHTTNNVAEYCGLLLVMREALYQGVTDLRVLSDSELMVSQMNGEFKVSSERIVPLYEKALRLKSRFRNFSMERLPREKNAHADRLTGRVLKLVEEIRNA